MLKSRSPFAFTTMVIFLSFNSVLFSQQGAQVAGIWAGRAVINADVSLNVAFEIFAGDGLSFSGLMHSVDQKAFDIPVKEVIVKDNSVRFLIPNIKAEVLKPELGHKPRVYYLNIPKKFVAGTVYDPKAKEIVEGATCTLTGGKGKALTATTDGFGDFWFRGLPDGATYTLRIAAKGFKTATIEDISTEKDVNLGDIALAK